MKKLFKVQSSGFKVRGSNAKDLEPAEGNLEPGTWNRERAAASLALGAALALVPVAALPQELTDPTRPPAGFTAAPLGAVVVAPPGNQLQSVIISPKRKAAIINGMVVELGEKYGDAVLTKVAEDEVVLRTGDSSEVLKLYPGVEKTAIARGAAKRTLRPTKPKSKVGPGAATQPGAARASGAGGGTR